MKVTSVDKANVLEVQGFERIYKQVHQDYPDVELEHMYVDNAAMQLVRRPTQFDVIVENVFGDILTDRLCLPAIGMLPSASIGGKVALYEPSHGSAPDIAGQDKANPLATILSAAMMLEYSFKELDGAREIQEAVNKVLAKGYRTPDIMEEGKILVGTREMGDLVCQELGDG